MAPYNIFIVIFCFNRMCRLDFFSCCGKNTCVSLFTSIVSHFFRAILFLNASGMRYLVFRFFAMRWSLILFRTSLEVSLLFFIALAINFSWNACLCFSFTSAFLASESFFLTSIFLSFYPLPGRPCTMRFQTQYGCSCNSLVSATPSIQRPLLYVFIW